MKLCLTKQLVCLLKYRRQGVCLSSSLAKEGFGAARFVPRLDDEEKGPALVFADAAQSIYLADMSGDGLTDIARIRNGEICYWPNLGYGRFGAKVTMDNRRILTMQTYSTQSAFDWRILTAREPRTSFTWGGMALGVGSINRATAGVLDRPSMLFHRWMIFRR
jgi:hypothetical protein